MGLGCALMVALDVRTRATAARTVVVSVTLPLRETEAAEVVHARKHRHDTMKNLFANNTLEKRSLGIASIVLARRRASTSSGSGTTRVCRTFKNGEMKKIKTRLA